MVLKQVYSVKRRKIWFENDVEMYGAQTNPISYVVGRMFENDVEMYGAQTTRLYV